LPFPERYWISESTAAKINQALHDHRRVIAIGTSVTRALESAATTHGQVSSGTRVTNLKISADRKLKVVDGLLTGLHIPGESHLDLLMSFVSNETLTKAYQQAVDNNYLWHEYGDLCLIITRGHGHASS
jgi:S-adenosylmethionine:tRNA ribosyltransferase-isomerase